MNKNIKNIYLHIGVAKSGTSSLQMSLLKSKKELEKLGTGYFYPKLSFFHHGRYLLHKFKDKPDRYDLLRSFDNDFSKFKQYIVFETMKFEEQINRTHCQNLIISGEQTARLNKKQLTSLKYYLENLAPNSKITIVVGIREHTSRFTSSVQQRIRMNKNFELEEMMKFESNFYRRKLSKFQDVFGCENIVSFKFEDLINERKGPIGLFFKSLNVNTNNAKLVNFKYNEGNSDVALDIVFFIDKKLPLVVRNQKNSGRDFGDTWLFGRLEGGKFKLPEEIIKELHDQCRLDKIWLKDNFNIDYQIKFTQSYKTRLIFNSKYKNQFKSVFIKLNSVLQKLSYEYLLEKLKSDEVSEIDKLMLTKLVDWIDSISSDFKFKNLEYFLERKSQNYRINKIIQIQMYVVELKRYYNKFGLIRMTKKIVKRFFKFKV
jgi:hypothetical protein